MNKRLGTFVAIVLSALAFSILSPAVIAGTDTGGPVLVDLRAPATQEQLDALAAKGLSIGVAYKNLPAVSGNLPHGRFAAVRNLDFVTGVRDDAARTLTSVTDVEAAGPAAMTSIANTFNLDFIDREETTATGAGVYVAILDAGLVPEWRNYLDESRVRIDLGRSFTGRNGNPNPDQLENDRNGHGMATSATVIGYKLHDASENGGFLRDSATGSPGDYLVPGVAPEATIIPVRVCDVGIYCWDSSIYSGLDYVVGLKKGTEANGELMGKPIVINMSLGGPSSSEAEEALFESVAEAGVLIVASAGNDGPNPMGWPGAYPVVISAGAGGWRKQWYGDQEEINNQWWMDDVAEDDASIDEWFMVWWSGVEHKELGQELDVVAPGRFILLPYLESGRATPPQDPAPPDGQPVEYLFISGTSFSAPMTTGVVALMLSVNPGLTQAKAEMILRQTALPIPAGSWDAGFPFPHENAWDDSKSIDPGAGTQTGWGLIQADGAVKAATSGKNKDK